MKIFRIILLSLLALASVSCATNKKLTYMQDLIAGETFAVPEAPEIKVKPGDKLKIRVYCKNPQLAMPFNIIGGTFSLNASGDETQRASVSNNGEEGYLVDSEGYVDFPVLGPLNVADLSLSEVKSLIVNEVIAKDYIKDPIVTVDFLNFQYTILGEVSSRGNKKVENNKINLIQAIAEAGDLTTSANYGDVKVIRTRTGAREVYSVNMYSKDLYQSPAFYLQQDDVIYVRPRGSKWNQDAERAFSLSQFAISLISVISNILLWVVVRRY